MPKMKKLIPELRFPEFKNEGEWEIDTIDNLVSTITPPRKLTSSDYQKDGKFPIIDQSKSFYCGWINDVDAVIKDGLPLIIFGDHTCILKITNKPFAQGADGIKILKTKNKVIPEFLYQYLQHNEVKQEEYKRHFSILKEKKVLFPKKESGEQQKIASCLSSLDEIIEAHSQKLELLKDHKKGLMQNLFPQEGEKVPKFRFKEFEKDKEWVEKSFEKVYDFKVTNSFSRALLNYEKGAVKNIHYGDIHTKFKTLFDIEKEDVPFINPDVSIENIDEENYCLTGDIVFADASEDITDIGKSIELTNLNNQRLLAGLHTLLARQKQSDLAVGFGGYLFKSDWIRKQIQKEAQGAKVLGISKTRINNILISFPKSKKEQQKIASCLSALDELISAEADKIEQLQQHKKGLMQGLFPKIEN